MIAQLTPIKTPVRRLRWLERIIGYPVWAKLEFQQATGSFKFRGALRALCNQPAGQPVIAASAGNHGLAVAQVARDLGIPVNICIPTNASRLKKERILATGAGLIEHGNGLDEATLFARQQASKMGWRFISPYNDDHVIEGNSDLAIEFLEQVPEIESVIVPIGGGGLASGFARARANTQGSYRIFGCEAAAHCSMSTSLKEGRPTSVPSAPTLADGLAVNLEDDSITFGIVRDNVSNILLLSEEELAACTYALLNYESILVEPAGAAGIVAAIRLAEKGLLKGPVGIPLCGGNLQRSNLAKIQEYSFLDTGLVQLLDLRGRSVHATPLARQYANIPVMVEDIPNNCLVELCCGTIDRIRSALAKIHEYEKYCQDRSLVVTSYISSAISDHLEIAITALSRIQNRQVDPAIEDPAFQTDLEVTLRWSLNLLAYSRTALEWRSPSYQQAVAPQFFDLGFQENPGTNYERYESSEVKEIEQHLTEVLKVNPELFSLTLTSSGMAAYTLIEGYLLRDILKPGDKVLLAPYIYFEASEQIESIPWIETKRLSSYSQKDIIEAICKERPALFFVDPLTNTVDQRVIDLVLLAEQLRIFCDWPLTLVIDGTMVSGALPPQLLEPHPHLKILYYESASKYIQGGLESCLAGFVVHSVEQRPIMDRLRRNMGLTLYAPQAVSFPRLSLKVFTSRMHRIARNAVALVNGLLADPEVAKEVEIFYPGHSSHPDYKIAAALPYWGGCVTFQFRRPGWNNRDLLDSYIESVIAQAQVSDLRLTKGVSFGFSIPRISAASAIAETIAPFLRLFVGDIGSLELEKLIQVLREGFLSLGRRLTHE